MYSYVGFPSYYSEFRLGNQVVLLFAIFEKRKIKGNKIRKLNRQADAINKLY